MSTDPTNTKQMHYYKEIISKEKCSNVTFLSFFRKKITNKINIAKKAKEIKVTVEYGDTDKE